MPIDWFTVGAQALNFLVLVWLMKRFLYRPILDAIDAREKRIAAELAAAAATMEEARAERDEFQQKNAQLDDARAGLLESATKEAAAERQRLLDEARRAAGAFAEKSRHALREEIQGIEEAVAQQTREEVFAISRQALAELGSVRVEERIVEVFCQRLRELDGEEKATLAEALRTATEPAIIRTGFELPPEFQGKIETALTETFAMEMKLHFAVAKELIGGIELVANGRKIAWSIAGYIESLEQALGEERKTA